jgi:hypothetical protein
MVPRSVAATQIQNLLVKMESASQNKISVTVKPNVPIPVMKVTNSVALRNLLSTMINDAVVFKINSSASQAIV